MADMHLETVYLAGQKSELSSDLKDLAVDIEAAWAEYTVCYGQRARRLNSCRTPTILMCKNDSQEQIL